MVENIKIDVELFDNYAEKKCGGKEVFLGCWSADPIDLDCGDIPSNIQLAKGKNWFAFRNGADRTDGLLFPKQNDDDPELVVFRGYLANEAIHSYSSAQTVKEYWRTNLDRKHNGIFSAATISGDGAELNIVTDIFGMGPIYHRQVGSLIFFSSNPGLLSMRSDKPNLVSWVKRMLLGYIPGNPTLTEGVESFVPASVTTFTKDTVTVNRWYDHKDLPTTTKPFKGEALKRSHEMLASAVSRCNNINYGDKILPLTSGYDSKRLLGHLMEDDVKIKCVTSQMPEPTGEDVDMKYASKIAKDLELDHTAIKMPDKETWCQNEEQKIYSLDAQSNAHSWSVSFFNHFKGQKGCFYDGIGGDNFTLQAWEFDLGTIDSLPQKLPACLKTSTVPSLTIIQWSFKKLYMPSNYGVNRSIISSVLWSTRNHTSLWSQQQAHPGHIILCPYFDLEYVELMLEYVVDEYETKYPQQIMLENFWKKLAAYPCSRDFEQDINVKETPDNVENIAQQREEIDDASANRILAKSLAEKNVPFDYDDLLNLPAKIALRCCLYNRSLRDRIGWWLEPVSNAMLWWQTRPFIVEINKDKKAK